MRFHTLRTTGFAAVGAAALVAATIAATPSSAGAAGGTRTIEVQVRSCAAATHGHSSCFAIQREWRTVSASQAQKLEAQGVARPASQARLGFGPAGGYTPRQLAKAYAVNPNAAHPAKVAIVDAFDDPSVKADLNHFDKRYGLKHETAQSFKVVNQQGQTSPLPGPDAGWAGEETLDVQAVRGICHACKILLVETDSNSNSDLATGVDRAVKMGYKIVSNSYGGPENHGQQSHYAHQGVAILASSGDSGWYDWTNLNAGQPSGGRSQTPASFPSVIGVGGTSLYLNSNGSRASEDTWNSNGPADITGNAYASTYGYLAGAGGSGCSTLFSAPPWQKNVRHYPSLGCGAKRSEVDVAAVADPFTGYDVYCTTGCTGSFTGWATFGGTSLASPVVAGLWALAGGPGKADHPAATLYKNAGKTYDVRVGGTGACDTASTLFCGQFFGKANPNTLGFGLIDCAWKASGKKPIANRGQCYAQSGYDGVSGVGAPRGLAVFK